ncbi:MAG: homoserine O-acetyltransferase [Proteobacteria bacterium]|nr:homoserine O-acetyltransferase [Pseudomonadota bacterium]
MASHLNLYKLNHFQMRHGGELNGAIIAYETWGKLNDKKDNALLIFTGLSTDSHAATHDHSHNSRETAGWWEFMLGKGKAIDTDKWFVICASSLGSCKGSTGPCSPDPVTKISYKFSFPDLTLEDIANSTWQVVQSLGIEKLGCVIGPSMGGMSALALILQHLDATKHMVNIAAGCHSEPFSTAIRSLQREAILTDVNFNNGNYSSEQWPTQGMKQARKMGMLSYRSAEEWKEKFPRNLRQRPHKPFGIEFPVESYLEHHAEKFVHQFDPVSYIYLSRAMDWFDACDYATHECGNPFYDINLDSALIVGARTDLLFPQSQQQELAELLNTAGCNAQLEITDSIQGHDAFLVDQENYSRIIGEYLQKM